MLEDMITILVKVLYYVAISLISTQYYMVTLKVKKNPFGSKVIMSLFIFATHMVLLIPMDKELKSIYEILQIIMEYILVCVLMQAITKKKIWTYVKLNMCFGISMIFAYGFAWFANSLIDSQYSNRWMMEIAYYVFVVAVAYVIFYIAIKYEMKLQMKMENNYLGIKFTIICAIGLISFMYTIAFVFLDASSDVFIGYIIECIVAVLCMAYILVMVNMKMKRQEQKEIELYTRELYRDSIFTVKEIIEDEIEYYQEVTKIALQELDEMYGRSTEVLSSLIEMKKKKAEGLGLSILEDVKTMDMPKILGRDIVTMVGNLLDNAIEASVRNEENKRNIYLRIETIKNELRVQVENYYTGELIHNGENFKTTKKDDGQHGLGINSVRNTADKYGYELNIELLEDRFVATIR